MGTISFSASINDFSFLFLVWDETESLGTAAANGTIVASPDER
jgi:hypothetical protein